MEYYVYILYSEKLDRYYIGATGDPVQRLQQHNLGRTKSTKSGMPWVRVHLEKYESRQRAFRRERYIKKQKSRVFIESLVNG